MSGSRKKAQIHGVVLWEEMLIVIALNVTEGGVAWRTTDTSDSESEFMRRVHLVKTVEEYCNQHTLLVFSF